MTASKSLPARPSLESLRKQAKKLARDVAAGDAGAIARARAHLPNVDLPLTQRNAQLVIAREYGFAGWQDLTAEVAAPWQGSGVGGHTGSTYHSRQRRRTSEATVAEYPALLSWQGDDDGGGLLGIATAPMATARRAEGTRFTRAECAELLIDAGAVVMPSVCEGLLHRAPGGCCSCFSGKACFRARSKFLRRSATSTTFAPLSITTRTILRPSMTRSCAPAASSTRLSRHFCWND